MRPSLGFERERDPTRREKGGKEGREAGKGIGVENVEDKLLLLRFQGHFDG